MSIFDKKKLEEMRQREVDKINEHNKQVALSKHLLHVRRSLKPGKTYNPKIDWETIE